MSTVDNSIAEVDPDLADERESARRFDGAKRKAWRPIKELLGSGPRRPNHEHGWSLQIFAEPKEPRLLNRRLVGAIVERCADFLLLSESERTDERVEAWAGQFAAVAKRMRGKSDEELARQLAAAKEPSGIMEILIEGELFARKVGRLAGDDGKGLARNAVRAGVDNAIKHYARNVMTFPDLASEIYRLFQEKGCSGRGLKMQQKIFAHLVAEKMGDRTEPGEGAQAADNQRLDNVEQALRRTKIGPQRPRGVPIHVPVDR